MTDAPVLLMRYEGEGSFCPRSPYWGRLADKHYIIGQVYPLIQHEERSHKTHAHFFSCVSDAWANLPDDWVERFPSPDALRRWCLIKSGFCDSHTLICSSKAEAQKTARFIRGIDEFSVVTVQAATVVRYTAHSQSYKAMDKDTFQRSKTAVLAVISEMLGTTIGALENNGGKNGEGAR